MLSKDRFANHPYLIRASSEGITLKGNIFTANIRNKQKSHKQPNERIVAKIAIIDSKQQAMLIIYRNFAYRGCKDKEEYPLDSKT